MATFLAAQGGLAFSQERMHCAMGMPEMEHVAAESARTAMIPDCCDDMTTMELCERMPLVEAGSGCCRIEQDHTAPKQAPGISTDRVDIVTAPARAANVVEVPARFVSPPTLPAHLPPVLDRKTDLRI